MTAFDALISTGVPDAVPGGRRTSASLGDWRQAVEHAQAKSWLGERNIDLGSQAAADGAGATFASKAAALPPGPLPERQTQRQTQRRSQPVMANASSAGGSARDPRHAATASPMSSPGITPVAMATPSTQAGAAIARGTRPPAASPNAAYVLGVRPRKRSLHIETGELGVSVWLRDAALNNQQANHLAAAIIANLGDGARKLASLYLNGHMLSEDTPSFSSSSSPNHPSE